MKRALLVLLGLGALAGCGTEDPPTNCGDSPMGFVNIEGHSAKEEDELRTCVDIHAASRLDATETGPGRDESYPVSQPGVIPWTSITFRGAVEACSRAGRFLCNSDELRAIAPIKGEFMGAPQYDETAISALSPTSDQTEIEPRLQRLNPVDMVVRGDTGKPPFPETTGSIAYWTYSPPRLDDEQDPDIPLLLGRLSGDSAVGGFLQTSPVLDESFTHPLVGFRCCINARMRTAFEPLGKDPQRVLEEEPEVPIEGQ
jgi:hypothetical protein